MEFASKRIGKTTLDVTLLGLGSATLGGHLNPITDADAGNLVAAAHDGGIRYFDAAPLYGHGRSEHMVGDKLRGHNDWILSTKVGRRLRPIRNGAEHIDPAATPFPFEPYFDYSYDGTMRAYEDSLQRLGLARIDMAFIHDIDTHGAETHLAVFETAMTGAYRALDELRSSGDIKAIGLGVNFVEPIVMALDRGDWDCFLLAGRYTLLEQEPIHTLFPAVARHGASIVIGGPFNSGVLAGRDTWNYAKAPRSVVERVKATSRVCDAHDVPMPAAALRFAAAHPLVASVIPGPRVTNELKQIFEWWNQDIPPALWTDLRTEELIDPDAPFPAT